MAGRLHPTAHHPAVKEVGGTPRPEPRPAGQPQCSQREPDTAAAQFRTVNAKVRPVGLVWCRCRSRTFASTPRGLGLARGYPLRGLACEVCALGVQPGRSTESLAGARTVDYSQTRVSMQSGDAPSSSMSARSSETTACVLVGGMSARSSAFSALTPANSPRPRTARANS
jgi:hypothetical protein